MDHARRIVSLVLTAAISMAGCSSGRTDGSPGGKLPDPSDERADRLRPVERHIIFTGIIGLVRTSDTTLRFAVPRAGGHDLWLMAEADAVDSTTTLPSTEGMVNLGQTNAVKVKIFELDPQSGDSYVITMDGFADTDMDTRDWSHIPMHTEFMPLSSPLDDDVIKSPKNKKELRAWGDLRGGKLRASWVDPTHTWRFDDDPRHEPSDPPCIPIAEEVCHTSSAAGPMSIRVATADGKAVGEIVLKAGSNGMIELRVGNTSGRPAPEEPTRKEDDDRHFLHHKSLGKPAPADHRRPLRCYEADGRPKESSMAKISHGHNIDYTFRTKAATNSSVPIDVLTVGSINCPPAGWCPTSPSCD